MISRREFISQTTLSAVGLFFSKSLLWPKNTTFIPNIQSEQSGFGQLISSPRKIIDLPSGFSYKIISRAGERMQDGFFVPARPDGMAVFEGPNNLLILLRNHEIWAKQLNSSGAFGRRSRLMKKIEKNLIYDSGKNKTKCLGAVTTLVYNIKTQKVESQYLSLAGTLGNCSGGTTPWNTWISCEEEFINKGNEYQKDHGYAFEVEPSVLPSIQSPIPLKSMGRFVRESVSVDPETSIVFQTEDQTDGLLYRFIPYEFGKLSLGGRLQCLAVRDRPKFDTRNWRQQNVSKGYRLPVLWIDLEETDSVRSSLRKRGFEKGAALFASGEGMFFDRKAVTFACTNGGPSGKGQIWRYTLSPSEGKIEEEEVPGILELFVEPNDEKILKHPDQIHMTPWGDMFVCEDGEGVQSIVGITPQGKIYKFAQNSVNDSEFTGVCFSPDGRTMFVNIQESGLTLVISGPWPSALK